EALVGIEPFHASGGHDVLSSHGTRFGAGGAGAWRRRVCAWRRRVCCLQASLSCRGGGRLLSGRTRRWRSAVRVDPVESICSGGIPHRPLALAPAAQSPAVPRLAFEAGIRDPDPMSGAVSAETAVLRDQHPL